jgi:anti-anti-sigma factor
MTRSVLIFLCYARDDRDRVSRLYDELRAEGFHPWMDSRNLLPGEIWEERITKVIKEADYFLPCLSRRSSDKSGFVHAELRKALRIWEEKREGDIYIIPTKLEDCQLPDSLSRFHVAALFEPDGLPSLVRAIRHGIEIKFATEDVLERQANPSRSLAYLTRQNTSFAVDLTLLEQHKLDHDYLPHVAQSLVEQFGWDDRVVYRALFSARELAVNAFLHGCQGDVEAKVRIEMAMEDVGFAMECIVIKVVSPGDGFDISQYLSEEKRGRLEDAESGGLGLLMAKRASDKFTHSRDGKVVQAVVMKSQQRRTVQAAVTTEDGVPIVVVSPEGRIDHASAEHFKSRISSEVFAVFAGESQDRGVIIDLANVEYISSAGLRILYLLRAELAGRLGANRRDPVPLVLYRPTPLVREILSIANVHLAMRICDSMEEARTHITDYFRNRR